MSFKTGNLLTLAKHKHRMMIQEDKARLHASHKMDAGTRWMPRSCLPPVSHIQLPSSHAGARDSTKMLSWGVELGHMATVKRSGQETCVGGNRGVKQAQRKT